MYWAFSSPSFPRSGSVAGEAVEAFWWPGLVGIAVVLAKLDLVVFGGSGGGGSSSKIPASARHGGELGWKSLGAGGLSVGRLQVAVCWRGVVEDGWRRCLSLGLRLEVVDDGLAGARGGVPADGRSKVADSGFVPDGSCGNQRSLAAIGLLVASGQRRSRVVALSSVRRRQSSADASGDMAVRSKDLQGPGCNFQFYLGSFALSPGLVACGVELMLGCLFVLYVSLC